jgi:hypothetical protein
MKTYNLTIQLPAKSAAEARQVQQALDTMVQTFQSDGIIRMDKLFHSDPFVRNMVKLKLGIK